MNKTTMAPFASDSTLLKKSFTVTLKKWLVRAWSRIRKAFQPSPEARLRHAVLDAIWNGKFSTEKETLYGTHIQLTRIQVSDKLYIELSVSGRCEINNDNFTFTHEDGVEFLRAVKEKKAKQILSLHLSREAEAKRALKIQIESNNNLLDELL